MFRNTLTLLMIVLGIAAARPAGYQSPAIDEALARQYFDEAQAISRKDDGELWGIPLYGPMLFADPATRAVVGNQADAGGVLTPKAGVFVGTLPETETIANTATKWSGVTWTMIRWPLPQETFARARLMVHELFHRVQEGLGFSASNPSNSHLDYLEGRIWLRLEWRALRRALSSAESERRAAIQDALVFRDTRRALFPDARSEERALEMNEGLAEYTGIKLRGTSDAEAIEYIVKMLERYESQDSFIRSFAYASGPAYGFLLDEVAPGWGRRLKPESDLGDQLRVALSLPSVPQSTTGAEKRALAYDGETLRGVETQRENERQKRLAQYRSRFIDGPILVLPLTGAVQYGFDPNNVQAFDETRTVYPTLRVSDDWGILEVSNGALVTRREGRVVQVQVAAPPDRNTTPLRGDGWTLKLKEGWSLEPGPRRRDLTIKRSSPR
jgi:hypothetical protein